MREGRLKRAALTLGLALALGACASLAPKSAWVQDTLYFGLSKPGGEVSQRDWQDFVDAQVTPRFPDGLTQWKAEGQWKETGKGTAKEGSRVLQIVHTDDPAAEAKIQAIRQAYRNEFIQTSVLRVKQGAGVEF
jgi:hypothetical protein